MVDALACETFRRVEPALTAYAVPVRTVRHLAPRRDKVVFKGVVRPADAHRAHRVVPARRFVRFNDLAPRHCLKKQEEKSEFVFTHSSGRTRGTF